MIDLTGAKLVVFDVDGTLYDQRALRLRMAASLLGHCLATGKLTTVRLLREYRRKREFFAERGVEDFSPKLVAEIARDFQRPEPEVEALVAEWMDRRPLPFLAGCRYPNVAEAFNALRESGRKIGVLSDYPAIDKLAAMGLSADVIVGAVDPEVGVLKPSVRGLERVMAIAGATPSETIMIGDRAERDGEMARAAGVRCYLRASKPIAGWDCFDAFSDFLTSAAA